MEEAVNSKHKHVVIITGQHMTANPRVWKEANSLAEAGYKVSVLTTLYDAVKLREDKGLLNSTVAYKANVNLIKGKEPLFRIALTKTQRKLAIIKKRFFKLDTEGLIIYSPSKQVRKAMEENADLYIVHQEAGLLIGCELLRKGKKVAFDFEDWYSRDYLNEFRPVSMLVEAESLAMKNGEYITCPSESMSHALFTTYSSKEQPVVVYNSFAAQEEICEGSQKKANSFVWMSQIVGPDRGIENFITAIGYLDSPLEIHIIGKIENNYKKMLESKVTSMNHRIFFYGVMPHHKLLSFISQFSVGLALENPFPGNKNVTVSNKMFQYLQAGIKVLATNTQGQSEIAAYFESSIGLVDSNNPQQWANAIKKLLHNNEEGKQQAIFHKHFAWEIQERKILELVNRSLKNNKETLDALN